MYNNYFSIIFPHFGGGGTGPLQPALNMHWNVLNIKCKSLDINKNNCQDTENNTRITNDSEIVNKFNMHFVSVGKKVFNKFKIIVKYENIYQTI